MSTKMLDPIEIVATYNCAQCSHQTPSVFQLHHHIQRRHKHVYGAERFHAIVEPERFPCICCDYKSYYQFELYEHCTQAHGLMTNNGINEIGSFCGESARFKCDHCEYASDSKLTYTKHESFCEKLPQGSTEEAGGMKPSDSNQVDEIEYDNIEVIKSNKTTRGSINKVDELKCDHCVYRTMLKSDLKMHMLAHESRFHCNHCSYRTNKKWTLNRHMLRHATDKEINWFPCNHCSYRCKRKSHLKNHEMNKHTVYEEINWFHCNQCSYRCKQKPNLKAHMVRRHATDAEIAWFQCNNCSYRASQKSWLKKHMLTHATDAEINWFPCNQCSYRTKHKYYMKGHMLKHATDEQINWFQCNNCSYRAKEKSRLKKHMLTHATDAEINWFRCNHCSYRGKYKTTFKRHVMKHAAGERN